MNNIKNIPQKGPPAERNAMPNAVLDVYHATKLLKHLQNRLQSLSCRGGMSEAYRIQKQLQVP